MSGYEVEKNEKLQGIEKIISHYQPVEVAPQKIVIEAMNYSLAAGGKRIRPLLMAETYALFGGKGKEIELFMVALEMIHTYSLVHDDLPAMDNDEYRRGRKTTHIVYGETMAILAGDGLLNYAFEVASRAFDVIEEDILAYQRIARAYQVLGKKAGIYGMIGGQTADILAEKMEKIDEELLLFIHENKTSALMEAAMMIGAILAGATEHQVKEIEKCGSNIGLAFQIQDDILDVSGIEQEIGKPVGSDEKNNKQTYVTLHSLKKAKQSVEQLSNEAISIVKEYGENAEFLIQLIQELIHRNK